MKKLILILPLLTIFFFGFDYSGENGLKSEMKEAAKVFGSKLSSILIKTLKSEGAVKALNVCSDTAQAITSELSGQLGMKIKRTSLKLRNEMNKPDKFELNILTEFDSLFSAGKLRAADERFQIIDTGIGKQARFIKPLFIKKPCLKCHGETKNMASDISALLKKKYPNDSAVNFKLGDFRGIISISKKIN